MVLTLSSDSDMDIQPSTSKPKSSTKPAAKSSSTPAKKRKSIAVSSSDDEVVRKPAAKAKAKKSKELDDFVVEDDEDEDDGGRKVKKAPIKSKASGSGTPAKKLKLKEDEDDDDKPAPAKKAVPAWIAKKTAGPSNPGSKEIPNGQPNCLEGLTFVFTGELDSLSRESGQELVKRFGGRVTTAPSSKTSYVVLGAEAGPKKLEMIKKHKIKTLTEDGFLELIGKRPAGKVDPVKLKQEEDKLKQDAKAIGPAKGSEADKALSATQLWTTKYAPTALNQICGNKGNVEKLSHWLEGWPKALKSNFTKPGPDAMGTLRCVLISGPPGIGKTTAAHLVAKLLGYDILELNASDVRSKKLLEAAFRSKVDNTSLSGFFGDRTREFGTTRKSVIIMDEVDGMSAGDRGGVGALNALIKKTKVPIIAICNDRSSPKMKPLMNTCFNMTFRRPSATEIRSRMMTIAFKEGIKMEPNVLDQLVAGSQSDIRQIVNMISTWKLGAELPAPGNKPTLDFDQSKALAKMNEKNTIQTPWTLYSKLTAPQAFSKVSALSLNDKLDFYFHDFSIMPLFVQENYLRQTNFSKASTFSGQDKVLKQLELVSNAADAMSDGDLIDAMIHGPNQQWSLMPVHGMMSVVTPAYHTHGSGGGYPMFPAWLGKNSSQGKLGRLLGEVQIRMRLKISGDRKEIRQAYIPTLLPRLVEPLVEKGEDGIDEVIELMDEYFLTKEDWDAILELGFNQEAVLKQIPAKVKSAFTRNYNKTDHPVPFYKSSVGGAPKKMASGGAAPDLEEAYVDDEEGDFEEEDAGDEDGEDEIGKDKLIKNKVKKPAAAKGGAKAKAKK